METPARSTVLCAVDLSDHSKAALYLAAGLATWPGANLVVLHVDASGGSAGMRAQLNALILKTLPGWLAYREGTETILRQGEAAHAILAAARETQAQIIVMGTRGRGAISQALLGSTAADVLRESPVPVAVVPPRASEIISLEESGPRPHLGIVLVPVDFIASSSAQLAWAAAMSAGSDHRLLMLHVVPRGGVPGHATSRMRALATSVKSAHGFKLLVSEGNVADQICHVIHHDEIRFVVLGRQASAPGKLAYRILQDTGAVVVMVP
jgi:nucleotide-binding universal stress UspA family protein